MKMIVGTKKGMTRIFKDEKSIPVTIVDVSDCIVTLKTSNGIELGLGKVRGNKALQGKYKELGHVPRIRRFFEGQYEVKVGDLAVKDEFKPGAKVQVSSVSKGKGFAGVVKRWGFAGGPQTHGQSDRLRAPGSIGAGTTPGRVLKGKRMAGRMGSKTVTLGNKEIIDVVEGYLLVSGPVPGSNGDPVVVKIQE
jgi:large subunit ribosomal protein L3